MSIIPQIAAYHHSCKTLMREYRARELVLHPTWDWPTRASDSGNCPHLNVLQVISLLVTRSTTEPCGHFTKKAILKVDIRNRNWAISISNRNSCLNSGLKARGGLAVSLRAVPTWET